MYLLDFTTQVNIKKKNITFIILYYNIQMNVMHMNK